MRIRSIKPEFWRSRSISCLDMEDRLLFVGLWSYVDDNGVGLDRLSNIAADLFADDLERDPRETFARVSRGLAKLSEAGRIARYSVNSAPDSAETVDYLAITNWDEHQRIDRPAKARYPLPTTANATIRESVARVSRECRESVAAGAGEQGSRGAGEQGNSVGASLAKRARALPDNWQPKPDTADAMRTEIPGLDVDGEHRKFTDHYRASGKAMKDWDACWRNWMRNTAKFSRGTTTNHRQQQTDDLFANAARRMGATYDPSNPFGGNSGTIIEGQIA